MLLISTLFFSLSNICVRTVSPIVIRLVEVSENLPILWPAAGENFLDSRPLELVFLIKTMDLTCFYHLKSGKFRPESCKKNRPRSVKSRTHPPTPRGGTKGRGHLRLPLFSRIGAVCPSENLSMFLSDPKQGEGDPRYKFI